GYSMLASYFLSSTIVPVLSTWFLKKKNMEEHEENFFRTTQKKYGSLLYRLLNARWTVVGCYLAIVGLVLVFLTPLLGTEMFPVSDVKQFQIRLRAPTGTRVERTEIMALKALDVIAEQAGPDNVSTTLAFVGTQPPTYPINTIYLWTSGPQEAV